MVVQGIGYWKLYCASQRRRWDERAQNAVLSRKADALSHVRLHSGTCDEGLFPMVPTTCALVCKERDTAVSIIGLFHGDRGVGLVELRLDSR